MHLQDCKKDLRECGTFKNRSQYLWGSHKSMSGRVSVVSGCEVPVE